MLIFLTSRERRSCLSLKDSTALSPSSPLWRKAPVPRAEPQTDGQTPVPVLVQTRTSCRQKDLLSFHKRKTVVGRDPGSFWYCKGLYGGLQDEKRGGGGKDQIILLWKERQDSHQTQAWGGPQGLVSSLPQLLTGSALVGWCCRSPQLCLG